jgi:hypothetical protein
MEGAALSEQTAAGLSCSRLSLVMSAHECRHQYKAYPYGMQAIMMCQTVIRSASVLPHS